MKQIIVVGAGMGGLSAAIHARLRGFDVLVVERSSLAGGKAAAVVRDGFALDPGPSILILPEIYRAVFARAGRKMEDYLVFQRLQNLTRLFFEGSAAVDLPGDEAGCLRVLAELAPNDVGNVRKLLAKLDAAVPSLDKSVFARPYLRPSDMMDRHLISFGLRFNPFRTYKGMVDDMFASPILRAFFYGFPSYSGQTYDEKSPGAFLIPYFMIRGGVWFPEGGVRAIPAAFHRLAVELGVEFRFDALVAEIELAGGRATGIRLESGEKSSSDAVVCNVDGLSPWAKRMQTKAARPSMSYFTLQWGLAAGGDDLEHHNLIVPRDFEHGFDEIYRQDRFPSRPIVYLNDPTALDPATAPAGKRSLFAVVTCPSSGDWSEAAIAQKRRAVMSEMERAGVDLGEPEFERVQCPTYFAQQHGNYGGSLYGVAGKDRFMGMFPLPNRDPEVPNLVYCGGAVQPGAGLPMVTLSGKFAADLL